MIYHINYALDRISFPFPCARCRALIIFWSKDALTAHPKDESWSSVTEDDMLMWSSLTSML